MRDIEFRGKATNGEWVFGGYIQSENVICTQTASVKFFVDPETVGQYTGLTDKNGVKVFEHDVVEHDGGRYGKWKPKQVVYGNTLDKALSSCCGFMLDGTQMFLSTNDSNDTKVIGNIFDNPELLNKGDVNAS